MGWWPPPPENSRVKLCWVVVSIDWWCCITNFRPLGPFLLVELEFRWWVGGGCKVIIMSNLTRLRLGFGWVVVRLGFWQLWPFSLYFSLFLVWKGPLQRKHFPWVLRAHHYVFGIGGARGMGKHTELIQNHTFYFFAPP